MARDASPEPPSVYDALTSPVRRTLLDVLVQRDGQTLDELTSRLLADGVTTAGALWPRHHCPGPRRAGGLHGLTLPRRTVRRLHHRGRDSGRVGGPRALEDAVEMKLELVPLPVADVDRAKAFYVERLGFVEDVDVTPAPGVRVVQLTPPGSACSLSLSTGLPRIADVPPGAVQGLHLVVGDIETARAELVERGVDISAIEDVGGGVRYAWFQDPDGNSLTLQEMPWRTGDAF